MLAPHLLLCRLISLRRCSRCWLLSIQWLVEHSVCRRAPALALHHLQVHQQQAEGLESERLCDGVGASVS
jgi:hypothetical protein